VRRLVGRRRMNGERRRRIAEITQTLEVDDQRAEPDLDRAAGTLSAGLETTIAWCSYLRLQSSALPCPRREKGGAKAIAFAPPSR
jgi:hypothetical protein